YRTRRTEAITRLDTELLAIEGAFAEKLAAATAARDETWSRTAESWRSATADVTGAFSELRTVGQHLFPEWNEAGRADRPLSNAVPQGVRFGDLLADMAAIPDGISADERLAPPAELTGAVPAFLPFP